MSYDNGLDGPTKEEVADEEREARAAQILCEHKEIIPANRMIFKNGEFVLDGYENSCLYCGKSFNKEYIQ